MKYCLTFVVFDVLNYSKVTAVPKITNCLCFTDFYHGKISSEIDLEQFCKNRENERKSYFKLSLDFSRNQ